MGLTIEISGNWVIHLLLDLLEEFSVPLQITGGRQFPEMSSSTQNLGLGLFKLMLSIPKASLQLHCTTEEVCVTDRACLGPFNVIIRVVELALIESQPRQGVVSEKKPVVPVERRCDSGASSKW